MGFMWDLTLIIKALTLQNLLKTRFEGESLTWVLVFKYVHKYSIYAI